MAVKECETEDISQAEADIYDRQIRLWGLEAQNKLRASSVLICGLSGLGSEVTKNLMLCGLRGLTLMDDAIVTHDDIRSNFLLAEDSLGKNRAVQSAFKAQQLNPMVKFSIEECNIEKKDADYAKNFNLIILIDQTYNTVNKWNKICREFHIRFISGSVFGWSGYSFFDFDQHQFLMKNKPPPSLCQIDGEGDMKSNEQETVLANDTFDPKILNYPCFEDALHVDWNNKKWKRKSKRLLPFSYFPIRAMLRAQMEGKLSDDEDANVAILAELWKEEVAAGNHNIDDQTVDSSRFDYFFGPQLSPVCATVGGIIGQEAIKALSENEFPLQNFFVYSALDTTGTICHLPPL